MGLVVAIIEAQRLRKATLGEQGAHPIAYAAIFPKGNLAPVR